MGDAALLVELGETLDLAVNLQVQDLARRARALPGVSAVIPAYTTLLVEYEPLVLARSALESEIASALSSESLIADDAPTRIVEIPTRYGGECGPDLEFVAAQNGISPAEVVKIHTAETFRVFMIGFAPGFPYLGIVPEQIAAPRLETPRPRVPAGSVGIAGRQTGIYPRESPGGWRLIGRTDVTLFDPLQDPPALLRPGDRVRFVPMD